MNGPALAVVFMAVGLLGLLSQAMGQADCVGQLTGRITAKDIQGPLPGATVRVRETGRGVVTDSVGVFRLTGLCPGTYTLDYQFVGYTTQTRRVRVPTESTLTTVTLVSENNLQEVEVTEHRSEAQQILQTQTQLTGQSLEATRGQSLGESLKAITGLYSIQTGPSISKPVIHGLHSNRILILNNGIRQEDQQWGSEHAPEIDAFLASRLTVIKGAASIRYGSDAIGGVVLVEPKAMPTKPGIGGEFNAVGASNGQMGVVSGILEQALAGKLSGLSWRVQGTLKQAGYAKTPHYFLENTSYRERNFSADVHYDHKNYGAEIFYSEFSTRIGLFTGAQVGSLADLYTAIARPEPLRQPGFSYDLGRPYQDVRHGLFKFRAFIRSAQAGTFTLTVARQQNRREEYDFVAFSGSLNPELSLKLTTHTGDLVWEPKAKTTKNGGAFSGSVGVGGITQGNIRQYLFLIPNFRNYGAGVFAIERYARDRWTYEAGLRADYRYLTAYFLDNATGKTYSDTHHWQNLTGSLGTSYQISPTLDIAANLSTAWRAPNASELYADGLHQSAVAYERGNPNLQQEQAYNGNLALEYTGKRLSAELGLYNNIIQNYIYLKPDSLPVVRQRGAFPAYSYNQVRASFRGVDATIRYQFNSHWLLTSKTSLLFAYDHTNRDYLVFIPPNRTDNSLRYQFTDKGRVVNAYASVSGLLVAKQNRVPAVGSREANGQVIFTGDFAPPPSGYFLVGAEAGLDYRVGNRPVSLIVTGSNLLDQTYRDYLDRFRYFTDALGRNIAVKLKINF